MNDEQIDILRADAFLRTIGSNTPKTDALREAIDNGSATEAEMTSLARQLEREHDEVRQAHDRYEKLRRLSPMQYHELYDKNIKTGEHFDTLVDKI
jgi:hypothetical protein